MLGIGAIAQLALCQFPGGQVVEVSPAWRRWLAQQNTGYTLNQKPTNDDVRYIIAHMFEDGRQVEPDGATAQRVLREFLPPLKKELPHRLAEEVKVATLSPSTFEVEDDEDELIEALLLASVQ